MLSLSIVAACIIGCNYAVICPSDTFQVGGARTSGSAQCAALSGIPDIATCKNRCESPGCGGNCQAFGYSERYDRCALYQSATPGSYPTAPDQILCSSAKGCPDGTEQVQGASSGTQRCQIFSVTDIGACQTDCDSACSGSPCQAFGYSFQYDRCDTYQSATPGSYGGPPDQIVCAVTAAPTTSDLECPAGTSQIGGIGAYFQNAQQYQGPSDVNIEQCRDLCDSHSGCTAFAFDANFCTGYNANSGHAVGTYSGGPQMDQILCAVTADFSAQSPGLFSVDGMVGYSNGNGQVYVQIPAYVVYGIVALILVNIVCLMVHCWNKSKGNSKEYKTVSMRSDIDEL